MPTNRSREILLADKELDVIEKAKVASRPVVLFLGPFAISEVVEEKAKEWGKKVEGYLGQPVRVVVGDPPYEVPEDIDGKGFWVRPSHPKSDE